MDIAAMSRHEPKVAKRIYLHQNGLTFKRPKMLVVNDRQIRDFSCFLNRVTSGIKAPIAVRNIYTPVGGHRVHRLDELQNGKHYVAGGNEQFKKMGYNMVLKQIYRPGLGDSKVTYSPVRTIQAVSRFRNLPEKPYLIHVFRNGDALFRGVRVLLPRKIMNSWEHVLEIITDKAELTLPAKRLCTLDGQLIHAVTDIRDGEKYVALEGARRFVKLPYCAIDPTPQNLRHLRVRRLTKPSTLTSESTSSPTTIHSLLDKPQDIRIKRLMPAKQHRGKERPFAGHKNKEARNKALTDARTDSVFGGSPTPLEAEALNTSTQSSDQSTSENLPTDKMERPDITTISDQATTTTDSEMVPRGVQVAGSNEIDVFHATGNIKKNDVEIIEYKEEESLGVFGKNGDKGNDSLDAEDVKESKDIEIEKPIDQEEAEEVEETVDVKEGETHLQNKEGETHLQNEEGETHLQNEEGKTHLQNEEGDAHLPSEGETRLQNEEGETYLQTTCNEVEASSQNIVNENITEALELHVQNINDSVDLAVAKKQNKSVPPSQIHSKTPSKSNSRLTSKSNTPLNRSKPVSKTNSKIPSKDSSRAVSKPSTPPPLVENENTNETEIQD